MVHLLILDELLRSMGISHSRMTAQQIDTHSLMSTNQFPYRIMLTTKASLVLLWHPTYLFLKHSLFTLLLRCDFVAEIRRTLSTQVDDRLWYTHFKKQSGINSSITAL